MWKIKYPIFILIVQNKFPSCVLTSLKIILLLFTFLDDCPSSTRTNGVLIHCPILYSHSKIVLRILGWSLRYRLADPVLTIVSIALRHRSGDTGFPLGMYTHIISVIRYIIYLYMCNICTIPLMKQGDYGEY